MKYSVKDFDYDLPDRLIAQSPAEKRSDSKLLIYKKDTGEIIDETFKNINKYLVPDTTLVVNNSKVEQCRLIFGKTEIFILKSFNDTTVEAMVRPGKKFKIGTVVTLEDDLEVTVKDVDEHGYRTLEFSKPLTDDVIEQNRHVPLPPYIAQNDALRERYQTVFAKPLGSKAAPTAGLHFTDELLDEIKKDHPFAEVTLHVGLGTFAPISDEDVEKESLHEELYEISSVAKSTLESASHVTAVGTTSLRTLESAFDANRVCLSDEGSTDIFIQPGYEFKMVDSLITNFHLPKSSLMMLVAALIGHDELMRVYEHAIDNEYRFYSFGDAMLIV